MASSRAVSYSCWVMAPVLTAFCRSVSCLPQVPLFCAIALDPPQAASDKQKVMIIVASNNLVMADSVWRVKQGPCTTMVWIGQEPVLTRHRHSRLCDMLCTDNIQRHFSDAAAMLANHDRHAWITA